MNEILSFVKDTVLSSLTLTLSMSAFLEKTAIVRECEERDGVTVFHMKKPDDPSTDYMDISARAVGSTVIFSIDAAFRADIGAVYSLLADRAVSFSLCRDCAPDDILAFEHSGPWWMLPAFPSSVDKIKRRTQNLVLRFGSRHCHLLPLCGDDFRCEIGEGEVYLAPGSSGRQSIKGDFLAVTVADDPFAAVREGYENARAADAIRVPLRREREYPELFEGFGWCTWNTFYHDMTSAKIYEKLDEFKEKHIPIKWMIIDDGWSRVNGLLLDSFTEDREKFPEGLAACIAKIKSEYGVERVGVWQSFLGYWQGVDPNGELYESQKENLIMTPAGVAVPAFDEERAFAFWDSWHAYLASCGVDFLKIDNQSSLSPRASGVMPSCEAARRAHRALERSVFKNFGGDMINCMGMDIENVLARDKTGVSRNSDDFYPGRCRNFVPHVFQNTYNAIWHGELYFCDYDMWWSSHVSAIQSGVLRAISGGPVYVSDAIGGTVREAIMPTTEEDGTILRCDDAARPTTDLFYTDTRHSDRLLKIWNRSGDAFVLALYNIALDEHCHTITDTFRLADIPELDCAREYVAYDYFTKNAERLCADDVREVTLESDGTALYNIYPIMRDDKGEYIMLGETDKYAAVASRVKTKTYLSDIIK